MSKSQPKQHPYPESKLAKLVIDERNSRGWSQDHLAESIGVTQQAISKIEDGITANPTIWEKLADRLGVPHEDMKRLIAITKKEKREFLSKNQISESPNAQIGAQISPTLIEHLNAHSDDDDIDVLGTAAGGSNGEFYFNGEVIDRVKRPQGLKGRSGVYAAYVYGDSMFPKFEDGDQVFVDAARDPAVGDYIILELHPDDGDTHCDAFIKRLKKRSSEIVIVTQFNPPKDIEFHRADIKQIHRVIPTRELLGI